MEIILKALQENRICGDPILSQDHFQKYRIEFIQKGITPKSTVGVCVNNSANSLLHILALLDIGAVIVPFPPQNPKSQTEELWHKLRCQFTLDDSGLKKTDIESGFDWPDDLALIMHSSGSTGVPKSIPYGWKRMRTNAQLMMNFLPDQPNLARHVCALSFCTSAGLYNAILFPLLTNGTIIYTPQASAF